MKGLIIKSPWIEKILNGQKTWEIRGSHTHIRGKVALIKSGTGLVYGTVDLVDSLLLERNLAKSMQEKHCISEEVFEKVSYKKVYAWVLENPVLFETPIPYKHPQGAVIWVNLDIK